MERIIIFRAKMAESGEWIYGDLIQRQYCVKIGFYQDVPPTLSDPGGDTVYIEYEVKKETVGQFTGLKDKNGKDIYEGDFITHQRNSKPFSEKSKHANVQCLVQWVEGFSEAENKSNPSSFNRNPGFNAYPIEQNTKVANWGYDWSVFHNCEITGNIHEQANNLESATQDNATEATQGSEEVKEG